MKKLLLLVFVLSLYSSLIIAQDDTTATEKDRRPVRAPFESGFLIDNQTTSLPSEKTLEFVMMHRFGRMDNGSTDLWGVYGASNIRLGLSYTFCKNLQLGIGAIKFDKLYDLTVKYSLLRQTRSNSIPVSVTFFGDYGLNSKKEESFGADYKFSNRLNYFSQLIISHKINDRFSIQFAPSFAHYNMTDDQFEHDKIGLSFSGRAKFSPTMSLIVNYDQPLAINGIREFTDESNDPVANFGIGVEISTSTHAFQIFVGNSNGLLQQKTMLFNNNRYFVIGFNITRLWNF